MEVTRRVYLDRQPRVGDTIECTYTNTRSLSNGHKVGQELIVTRTDTLTGDCVFAYNKRTDNTVCIHDRFYRIYEDITQIKTGEQRIVKRVFGIPIYSKIIEIYEEV